MKFLKRLFSPQPEIFRCQLCSFFCLSQDALYGHLKMFHHPVGPTGPSGHPGPVGPKGVN